MIFPISINHRCAHFKILRPLDLDLIEYVSGGVKLQNQFGKNKKTVPVKIIFLKSYMGKYRCSVCGHVFSVRQKMQLDKFTDYLIQIEPSRYNPAEIQRLGKGIGMVKYQKRDGKIYEIAMAEYAKPDTLQF